MNLNNKLELHRTKWSVTIISIIAMLGVYRLSTELRPYATGDAVEYTLMTEAFYNHFTPDVRSSDFETFKKAYTKTQDWSTNDKAQYFDDTQKFIAQTNLKPLEYSYAFFVDKRGSKYSCHFFFYSLLNIPARIACSLFDFNPLYTHQITNLILVLITCFVFLKYAPFNIIYTTFLTLLFFYSTIYWYLSWQHPEIFTVCFVSIGFLFFLSNKKYVGLFFITLAALQNQPISIFVAILAAYTFFNEKISIKNTIKIALSTCLVLAPSLFYYYHFGESNLIKYQGALSFDYVTFTRVFGLFFDINQGAILAIPLILFFYIFLLVVKLIRLPFKNNIVDILIVLSMIVSICFAGTIDNWNHGQAVVNRYVTYYSGIMLMHFLFLLYERKNTKLQYGLLTVALISQMITVIYHQRLHPFEWSTNQPKPISNWVLDNYPALYNPDPVIFMSRYNSSVHGGDEPSYYISQSGKITKFMVYQHNLNGLEKYGFPKKVIDSITPHLNFVNKWAYINIDDNLRKYLSVNELQQLENKRKIERQILTIKSTLEWFRKVEEQAKNENITLEKCLENNARYVLNIVDDTPKVSTTEEKINNKISEIKANAEWLETIKQKAIKQNVDLDLAIYNDAKWMVEQGQKK